VFSLPLLFRAAMTELSVGMAFLRVDTAGNSKGAGCQDTPRPADSPITFLWCAG
jgi:hypothetical protein